MKHPARLSTAAVCVVASVLGLLIAAADVLSPFGDDSAKLSILLWLLASAALGFARPGRPWAWAVLVGPWLPLTHLGAASCGLPGSIYPNTYGSILLLFPVAAAVCSVGAYGGALVRRAWFPAPHQPLSPAP